MDRNISEIIPEKWILPSETNKYDEVIKGFYDKTSYSIGNKEVIKDYQYDTDDSLKRLESIVLSIGAVTINQSITYDDDLVVTGKASTRIESLSYDIDGGYTYTYTYDNKSNITDIEVTNGGTLVESYRYQYDDINQLTSEEVSINKDGTVIMYNREYIYDSNGNLLFQKDKDSQAILYEYNYGNAWDDQLTHINGEAITYNNSGNPIMIGSDISLKWEGRQLVKYIDSDKTITYKYNDAGYRIYIL